MSKGHESHANVRQSRQCDQQDGLHHGPVDSLCGVSQRALSRNYFVPKVVLTKLQRVVSSGLEEKEDSILYVVSIKSLKNWSILDFKLVFPGPQSITLQPFGRLLKCF